MKYIQKLVLLFTIGTYLTVVGQQTPALEQNEAVTIVGATAHIGDGSVIEKSVIIFEDGKISIVTDIKTMIPYKGKIINAEGMHVYPGFIAPNTTLGLAEINQVRATKDFSEIGSLKPHIRSIIAYNAESQIVESLRPNGVLIGQITPRSGIISGTSSVVQLDAWNWEDALIKEDDGVHLNWPNTYKRGRWWIGEPRGYSPNKDYQDHVDKICSFIKNAHAYGKGKSAPKNESYKAMQGLFDGSKKLYVHTNGEKEIIDAIHLLKENGILELVLVGGYESYKVTDLLVENNIPVLVRRIHTTPTNEDHDYDLTFRLPKLLLEKGVLVALQTSGQMERMNTRNLPFYAGQVVGQGLDKELALQLITLNAAKILGIDKNYGSLEKGKSATLFISEGDALDVRSNLLTHAFIDGRKISLETHQTELWKRYSKKYSEEE